VFYKNGEVEGIHEKLVKLTAIAHIPRNIFIIAT
jgi:hypothetical protein